jgi:hypothetical protein
MHLSCLRDRLHGFLGRCGTQNDFWEVIAIVEEALRMENEKGRSVVKIVYQSNFVE